MQTQTAARTAVVRTSLTQAEHRAFSKACERLHTQKAEALRAFALWFIAHQGDLAAQRPDWLGAQFDARLLPSVDNA